MAVSQQPKRRKNVKLREFVVRLEQPGLYDNLFNESVKRTRKEGRRVPMTDIAREAIEAYLTQQKAA